MKDLAPIIAGIDFSASSPPVLRHALHAAGLSGARVIALHVLDASDISFRTAGWAGVSPEEGLEEQARRKLADWVEKQVGAGKATIEIRRGRAVDELHESVKANGASLLVIAANDNTKNRLGTTASRCVRSAPCDVMVLRNWQTGNFSKIVVCSDFSPAASLALGRAATLAAQNGAELEIVHVMYPPARDLWGELLEEPCANYVEETRTKVRQEMERFIDPHRDALAKVAFKTEILESTVPAISLTHHIKETGADLVVMGTRGQSRFLSHFMGTNAERLMQDATVSVLAVRDPLV